MGPDAEDIWVTNRSGSAVAVGALAMLDNRRSDAASTSNQSGINSGGVANTVTPTRGDATSGFNLSNGIYVVAMSAAADDAPFRGRLRGPVQKFSVNAAVVLATTAAIGPKHLTATGAVLTVVPTTTDGAVPHKTLFIPLTAIGSAGTTDGWFDGIHGFGSVLSVTGLT